MEKLRGHDPRMIKYVLCFYGHHRFIRCKVKLLLVRILSFHLQSSIAPF